MKIENAQKPSIPTIFLMILSPGEAFCFANNGSHLYIRAHTQTGNGIQIFDPANGVISVVSGDSVVIHQPQAKIVW